MTIRFLTVAASLTVVAAAVVGCGEDAPGLTGTTVRLAVIAGGDHGGAPFLTPMTQEVTTVPPWEGDPDGAGEALITVNLGQREICWRMSVRDIALPATSSHIHRAGPGVRGAIVVPLSAPDAAGMAVGCASDLDPDLLQEILVSPGSFYVNVHTSEFPPGAIRGQLAR